MTITKILGIDPGLSKTGWGLILLNRGQQLYLDCGSIHTSTGEQLPNRLLEIFNSIKELVLIHQPDFVALEETYVNTNSKSSLHLAHARAAAMLAIAQCNLTIIPYQAKTVKKVVTGNGGADKEQVAKMLKLRLNGLDKTNDKDAIDALALAFCHSNYI
ncbi:MAG: crossover junction endodeoxyribonuclease RuvC [Candidatus Midichloria mitochondrii]|uniref:Crossover junction endodeoxyribonuclease RuvC n=1 Tax=Midichloria mitochondrii (strain IricVA) TaxID=696127 RepID=F7XV40_MIDMI|nr:crossover junction endodeoxyribonuclease RuvC [Candidatus Midichloria mitochondrii]AEI88539.1 crossover junction endodeoxyribonuclease RuvC [Candidatus Midichloria mitochondrii IricVA]MDJ1256047.1 crossover junction endodeoxyribonuclease RuvC [Candidatus Midichloria mitochondrii]MDJ1287746.1 crossover junction endodeoxyribonuclease RuvC [Candidatus Midichloria mitochondrii]MDJ1298610.1 crossover junction endodeoxyribonuclease RuvC [Candidatus Midichloria mitochondrii]MDJ1312760.1 crossover 